MKIRFLTSTPFDIRRGSGTYVGIHVLARALEQLGHTVAIETPRRQFRIYTLERLVFNRSLRAAADADLTIGFDMDGYRIAAQSPHHVAALKGVIADEVRFESGGTALTMSIQARCERLHVHRSGRVLVTSHYCAKRVQELYGVPRTPVVVPELIDLPQWRAVLAANPAGSTRFTVLFVGRFYIRKRVDMLLRAAALLRSQIPSLEVRIVGDGPCRASLHQLARDLQLDGTVSWLGDIPRSDLAREFNRCMLFCLPSVQEGFGIVLLEAMAAGRPIVASRAAAIPEVIPHGVLTDPDNPESLAAAIRDLYASPEKRNSLASIGSQWVEQFDAPRVARLFLDAVAYE